LKPELRELIKDLTMDDLHEIVALVMRIEGISGLINAMADGLEESAFTSDQTALIESLREYASRVDSLWVTK
jgi:hypothetical protein